MNARVALVALAALTASSCGGGALRPFSTDWTNDGGESIAHVLGALGPRTTGGVDVAVAVAKGGNRVLAVPLTGQPAWSYVHALDARPAVAGSVVVVSGAGEVVALDAQRGAVLWKRPTGGLALRGVGDDRESTALTFSGPSGSGTTLLVVDRAGHVKRQIETDLEAGTPAVYRGVVFVPWQSQYISAIDIESGEELGRAVLRDKASRAFTSGGRLYFGEAAYLRFDEHIAGSHSGHATRLALPPRVLPGMAAMARPGTRPTPPLADATDRARLFARPAEAEGGGAAWDSYRYYATYFRYVYGLSATDGALAWVHAHTADVLGGSAVTGGVLLCDETGGLVALAAGSGEDVARLSFGEPIASCVVQAESYVAPAAAGPSVGLDKQIALAVRERAPELVAGQLLLIDELARTSGAAATGTLIELADDAKVSPATMTASRDALAQRRDGAEFMLRALERHYDFLAGVETPPPVRALATALGAMREPRAAPLLAAHLEDPANLEEDVAAAAKALALLATPAELATLERFVRVHRASYCTSNDIQAAVVASVHAIARLRGPAYLKSLAQLSSDERTCEITRSSLGALHHELTQGARDADGAAKDGGT